MFFIFYGGVSNMIYSEMWLDEPMDRKEYLAEKIRIGLGFRADRELNEEKVLLKIKELTEKSNIERLADTDREDLFFTSNQISIRNYFLGCSKGTRELIGREITEIHNKRFIGKRADDFISREAERIRKKKERQRQKEGNKNEE